MTARVIVAPRRVCADGVALRCNAKILPEGTVPMEKDIVLEVKPRNLWLLGVYAVNAFVDVS